VRATAIDPDRKFKRLPGQATRSGGAYPVIDDTGAATNFKCPECGQVFGTEEHSKKCNWSPTETELRDIRSRDPEGIPALCYNAKTERWLPLFNQNTKQMSGEERRKKNF